MKKEIEVYLPPHFDESNGSIILTRMKCRESGPKAILIIDLAEKALAQINGEKE